MSTSQFRMECDVFSALCWKIGTPVAWRALCALQRSDWNSLTTIKVRAADYVSAFCFQQDYQIAAFFKKYPGFDLGFDRKEAALKTFWKAEALCYHSNERLSPLLHDVNHYGEDVRRFITTWRKTIRKFIGKAPLLSSLEGKFGPGSTFQNKSDQITVAHKLSDHYTITKRAESFLHSWDQTAWSRYAACGLDTVGDKFVATHQGTDFYESEDSMYAIRSPEVVRGNRFTTVPKDASKDRGICIEPSVNVFYQLAVGSFISRRMQRRVGFDKSTCQDYHKVLARLGSLTRAVATIDLSNASDTVCKNLVKLLLPPDWFGLVDQLRSSHTLVKGKWVKLEKFSSMGNGYTFELETLIFRTLCETVGELEGFDECPYTPGLTISVYGDDIIVPTSMSRSVVVALKFFGFTTNEAKTFTSGPFRESCGGDYFNGFDVRPHFQKEELSEPHQLIALANGLHRFGLRSRDLGDFDTYRDAWFRCLDGIPRQIRICRGPTELGDIVIHDALWQHINPRATRNCIRYLRVWRPVTNRVISWNNWRPGVVLAAALYGVSSEAPNSYTAAPIPGESLRRSGVVPRILGSYVSGYRFGRVAYS